jgi:hypothetical protein
MNLKNLLKYFIACLLICVVVFLVYKVWTNLRKDNSAEDEYFLIDSSKLGVEVTDQDLGIRFYPPKNWTLRPTSISRKIESRGVAEKFIYQPIYVFFNDSVGALLSVGKVAASDSTLAKSARINYYKNLLNEKYKGDGFSSNEFVRSKIYFNQVKFVKHNLISLKIFFENSHQEIIQFDYTVPSNHYDGIEKFVKSSIGSIVFF